MDIKNLELTESDFDLLIEGLDSIPSKGAVGELMGGLLEAMMGDKIDKENPKYIEMQFRKEREKLAQKRVEDARKDDLHILKGKLAMLKRWLITQGAIKQTQDIIDMR